MSANRYLSIVNGIKTLFTAVVASVGAADAGKLAALNASGRWDQTLMPDGLIPPTVVIQASEALVSGDWVNVTNVTGSPRVRKANAGSGIPATGFVLSGVASGASATVYLEGVNSALTGLTPGTLYFLGTTSGGSSATAPSASGQIVQEVGTAISATAVAWNRQDYVSIQ